MSEEEDDYGYPLGNHEHRHPDSITQEFHSDTAQNTNFSELEFQFEGLDFTFRPVYYPNQVTVGKERDIVREKGICRNEYVKDVGTHNREIHVVGFVSAFEDPDINDEHYKNNLQSFHDMCDFGQRGDLLTMQWSGQVLLMDAELEGPEGVDPDTGHFLYEYTLDFISTGLDEMGASTTGIIDEGVTH